MIRNTTFASLLLSCLSVMPAFAEDDLLTKAREVFQPIPTAPPELPGNPSSPAKVELGKMLYFDPRLSASHVSAVIRDTTSGSAEPTQSQHP